MIIGQYVSKVTSARRIAFPKAFRDEISKSFVLTRWYEKCLIAVSKSNWEILTKRVVGENKFLNSPIRDTERFIFGSAYVVKSDKQGRVVLPKSLMDYAKIATDVVFVGLGDRIEIWDKKEWEKREIYAATHANSMLETIAKDA